MLLRYFPILSVLLAAATAPALVHANDSGAGLCATEPEPLFGGLPGVWRDGLNVPIRASIMFDDGSGPALHVAGEFRIAGGVLASSIAKWDGSTWSALGAGIAGCCSGPNSTPIRAMAVYDDGSGPALYAAGSFLEAGGAPANRIARWDGTSWSTLGNGLNNTVYALTVFDDGQGDGPALYAAGQFTIAGGTAAYRIARWDGTSWSAVGSGIGDQWGGHSVRALTVVHDGPDGAAQLYAGGDFTFTHDGAEIRRVARWNGTTWSAVGAGFNNGTIHALTAFDSGSGPRLIAGGDMLLPGGQYAIASWNGTTWSGLGIPWFGTSIRALAVDPGDDTRSPALYVGGQFSGPFLNDEGVTVWSSNVARWTGSVWRPLAGGLSGGNSSVATLTLVHNDRAPSLWAGGNIRFALPEGPPLSDPLPTVYHNLARWDGDTWHAPDGGLDFPVQAMHVHDDGSGEALYVAGLFESLRGTALNGIARWDGEHLTPLAAGMTGGTIATFSARVLALASFDDGRGTALYAGGDFTLAGDEPVMHIARWDGNIWSALDGGLSGGSSSSEGRVNALAEFDDGSGNALYVGGSFAFAGAVNAQNIARWNGRGWSAVGDGLNGRVRALAVFNDGSGAALYAGGSFTLSGNEAVHHVARWNGTSWSALGDGTNDEVYALLAVQNGAEAHLVVGGEFTEAGGAAAQRIAAWNGAKWSPLGQGMDGRVYALSLFDDGCGPALHAGGSFRFADGASADAVAVWRDGAWSAPAGNPLESPFLGPVSALTPYRAPNEVEASLYLGGLFLISSTGDSMITRLSPGAAPACPADLSGDGLVDTSDLILLLTAWGPCTACPHDLTGDGIVDMDDVLALLAAWGPCP